MKTLISKMFPMYRNYRIKKIERIVAEQKELLELLIYIFNEPGGIARIHFPDMRGLRTELVVTMPVEMLKHYIQEETVRVSNSLLEHEALLAKLSMEVHFFGKQSPA